MSLSILPSLGTVPESNSQSSSYPAASNMPALNEEDEGAVSILQGLWSNSRTDDTGTSPIQKRKFASLEPPSSGDGEGGLSEELHQRKKTFSDAESRIIVYFRDFFTPSISYNQIHQTHFSEKWTVEQIRSRYRNLRRKDYLKKLNAYRAEIKRLVEEGKESSLFPPGRASSKGFA